MAQIQFVFPEINASLQIGDTMYFTSFSGLGGFSQGSGNITEIGEVSNIAQAPTNDINGNSITSGFLVTCSTVDNMSYDIPNSSFVFFSKDNSINTSSLLGYFGEVKFENDSFNKAELYSVACDITQCSK